MDTKLYLEGDILTKVDRASMANSLEVRVPLLNHRLTEWVAEVPQELKLHGLTSKSSKFILKKAMEGILPNEVLTRKKKGFNVPVAYWLNRDLKELVQDQFAPAKLKREGFLNADYVQKLLAQHAEGTHDNRKQLWTLLVFELWYERYMS